jgi:hypothetical protein
VREFVLQTSGNARNVRDRLQRTTTLGLLGKHWTRQTTNRDFGTRCDDISYRRILQREVQADLDLRRVLHEDHDLCGGFRDRRVTGLG